MYRDPSKRKRNGDGSALRYNEKVEVEGECDDAEYWKRRVVRLEKLLEANLQWEILLIEELYEGIENLERQSSPVEELSQVLKRTDNFLHFVLQNALVVIGHRYNRDHGLPRLVG